MARWLGETLRADRSPASFPRVLSRVNRGLHDYFGWRPLASSYSRKTSHNLAELFGQPNAGGERFTVTDAITDSDAEVDNNGWLHCMLGTNYY
jgi:hypothetical protein